jgi:LysR family transcriptional regulator, low CO2-responsive transcriptional regulator
MLYTELRSFHAVALNGGFSSAARALNISQPTLSMQVKALESFYEVELFWRVGRQSRLTPAGQDLFKKTLQIIQNESEAKDLLNSFKGLESGSLRIAAVGPFHATDMVAAFNAQYPSIDLSIQLGNSQRSFERLIGYESDVGIIAEVKEDTNVITLPYSSHDVVVFVNSDHYFFEKDSISIRELENQKVIQRELGSTTRNAIEHALLEHQISMHVVLEIGSREGIWKAVEQGIGIGFVADFEFIPHSNLRAIRIHDAKICTQYFLAYLKERKASKLINAFCDIALSK